MTLISQSGWQSMYGGYSWGPILQQELDRFKRRGDDPWSDAPSRICEPAPLAIGYGLLLALGLAMALILPLGHVRSAIVLALGALAVGMLALQVGVKFPLEQRLAEQGADAWRPFAAIAPGWNDIQSHLQPIRYTPMFYLACGFAAAAVGLVLLEWYLTFGPGRTMATPTPPSPLAVSPYAYEDEEERPSRRGDRPVELEEDEEPR